LMIEKDWAPLSSAILLLNILSGITTKRLEALPEPMSAALLGDGRPDACAPTHPMK
jgi:hypothetical protein